MRLFDDSFGDNQDTFVRKKVKIQDVLTLL